MKRIFTVILFVVALLTNVQAQADRWTWMAVAKDGTNLYIDKKTIQRANDSVTVWEKFAEGSGAYTLHRTQIHRSRQFRILAYYEYTASGDIIRSSLTPTPWTEAAPNSLQEAVNQYFFPDEPPTVRY